MSHCILIVVVSFAIFLLPVHGQTATDPNEGSRMTYNSSSGAMLFSWWARSGKTYFVQQSYDLINWVYVPIIFDGAGAPEGINFFTGDSRHFWRLQYADTGPGSGASADFDGDGLSNSLELTYGTNPFNPDSDGDGMTDGWEVAYGLNPLANDASGDPDSDGYTNLDEFTFHINPQTNEYAGGIRSQIYTYDAAGRILTTGSQPSEVFTYDSEGNISSGQ